MDIRLTFVDGSEALAHYGVKGMKWGIWNPDTRARYNGKGLTVGNTPTMGGGYDEEDQENLEEWLENQKPLDEQWNEFVTDIQNSPGVQSGQEIAEAGQQYVNDVLDTGTKFGTDSGRAADSASRFWNTLTSDDHSNLKADFDRAVSDAGSALSSGADYVSALFGQRRKGQ